MIQLEQVNFNLNRFDEDGTFHIHTPSCYVMFQENGVGLSLISRALGAYQRVSKSGVSSVGNRHDICIIREKLQEMRFELL